MAVSRIDEAGLNINQYGNRNLIINGAMQVAQRGTSATASGYSTVDRFVCTFSGHDEAPTIAQHTLTSSDTGVYEKGFRESFHITNGNQTSGAGTSDRLFMQYRIEAQDIAKSGWDYTSSSSNITLSFYCRSSVAQNFYGRLTSQDGTQQNYAFETGSLTADTWTRITKTIPGNSSITIDDNNDIGLSVELVMFRGTDTTDNSVPLNAWQTYSSSARMPDNTSTWYTTNDATFEITGVQVEVGDTATDFEHRTFADELAKCQRYFQTLGGATTNDAIAAGFTSTSNFFGYGHLNNTMRAAPTASVSGTNSHIGYTHVAVAAAANGAPTITANINGFHIQIGSGTTTTSNAGAYARITNTSTKLHFDAEL